MTNLPPLRPRTLADYRPQHDEDCASRKCVDCGDWWGGLYHTDYRSKQKVWPNKSHAFRGGSACSCGLDALLRVSGHPRDEQLMRQAGEVTASEPAAPDAAAHDEITTGDWDQLIEAIESEQHPTAADPDQAIQQAINELESWVIGIIHREPHVDVPLALHRPIQKLLSASRASLEEEIARLKADVLHILNTLDMPAGEHHERLLAGWASAIGQMSARIQALPSGLLSFDTRSEHGGSGGPHMIASLTGPLPHLWPVGLKTQTDVYSCE